MIGLAHYRPSVTSGPRDTGLVYGRYARVICCQHNHATSGPKSGVQVCRDPTSICNQHSDNCFACSSEPIVAPVEFKEWMISLPEMDLWREHLHCGDWPRRYQAHR